MHRTLTTPTADYKIKWESTKLMDCYYVVGVTAIPYPTFGVLINISKKDIAYRVTISNISHYTCLDFTKKSSQSFKKKGKWVYCKHCKMIFGYFIFFGYMNIFYI